MASNQDNNSVYKDLVGFLQAPRIDLRLEATKAVLQVVTDRNEVLQLLEHGVLLPLLRIISDDTTNDGGKCAENALRALVYMSSSVEQVSNKCMEDLLQHRAVPRLIELILSMKKIPPSTIKKDEKVPTNILASKLNFALALLANLTRTEQGILELVGKTLPDEAVKEVSNEEKDRPTMELLLDRYLNRELILTDIPLPDYTDLEPVQWDVQSYDPYQHFSAILMNATQLEAGRKFIMRIPQLTDGSGGKGLSNLERLVPQLTHLNPIRRRGISGMIRNCCLETDASWWLLNEVKLTSQLLYPLAGPEELDIDEKQGMDPDLWLQGPDKEREIDSATRQHLVEAILLLCASGRRARETLRVARTYVILKYADMVEESEAVGERINECVQYLRRDEEGTEEGSSDRMVEEATRLKLKLLPASQVGPQTEQDYDDVD